ncbi:MAG: hypothetical protein IJY20_02685 [Clostridia bacterium]|nr:hypothetical protein [Clostridia bacterium]
MRHSFFPQGGSFYKTNLHCHTIISDGKLTAEQVKEAYLAHGYSAVAFTDHEVLIPHGELSDDRFIALNGLEVAIKERSAEQTGSFQKVYHFNLLAREKENITQPYVYPDNMTPGNCRSYLPYIQYAEEMVYRQDKESVNDLIRRANEAGFLVTLNHPAWSMISPERYLELDGLHGIEVFNTACYHHGDCSGLPLGEFLRRGKRLVPVGGDDNHNAHGFGDSFSSFTMLCATEFSYEGLMEALANGWCYASNGPEIYDIWQEGDTIGISCSPASRIILLTEGRHTPAKVGEGLQEATFTIDERKTGMFVRLEVVDACGRRAISRGIFLDEWSDNA